MLRRFHRLSACALLGSLALLPAEAREHHDEAAPTEPEIVTSTPDVWGDWGVNLETFDPDTAAGDDLYRHVNGAWLTSFEIPADRSSYGAFTLLAEKSEQRVRFIIEELAADAPDTVTLEGKIAAIYNAFMDTEAIEARGLAPAQPYLDAIAGIETREDLARIFARPGFASPFGAGVSIDSKQSDQNILYISQAGLGLGDRDLYLVDSEKNQSYRAAYRDMMIRLLDAAGYDAPEAAAEAVLALERELARAHWDRAAGRNRDLTYNRLDLDGLKALSGGFPVEAALEALGVLDEPAFIVRQVTPTEEEIADQGLSPAQVEKLSGGGVGRIMELAQTGDLDAWKAWLTTRFLVAQAGVLPARIDETVFAFYGTTLNGQEVQRERWKRAVSEVQNAVGEGVGKVYAERYFPAENKIAMEALVANLREAMALNLADLDWMGDATREEARDKLNKFTPKIGYPAKFETYETLRVGSNALDNSLAVAAWALADNLAELGQPIDPDDWFMLPQTVNAYYSPTRTEIVFPAAILQPPFFNLSADPAVNYGAIGGVIGHEIGHGFDDQGSRSDGDGNLRNWWTADDRANFEARTSALVSQYNTFCPLDDGTTCVNGALGLGENIGDLGGLSMAYRAYQLHLNGEEAPVIDGLTGDQRFFIGWAQVWRFMAREDALRQRLVRGPHSPPRYRVNGVVRNMDAWYEAFGVTEDHALYIPPEERIRIW